MRQKPALTADDCHKMMAACKAEAQKNKWPVTIAIVDDSGAALLLERLDGCGAIASTVAMGKAQTSALTKRPSKFFEDRVKERPAFVTFPTPGVMFQGGMGHVSLATTITLSSPTTLSVYCPDTFTWYGVTATTSVTATPVTNIH